MALVGLGALVGAAVVFLLLRSATPKVPPPADPAELRMLVAKLVGQKRATSVGRVREWCHGVVSEQCSCAKVAIREALDASLVDDARRLLPSAAVNCAETLAGQEAEIDARAGDPGAESKARAVLRIKPSDPYAAYAIAHLAWARHDARAASRLASAAVAAGRGGPAHLLVGLLALDRGEIQVARDAFTRILETEPADVAALYDIALCDQRLGHYGPAREGYLSVLRENPRHLDARYNLVILTLSSGFREEAAHQLAELKRLAPDDPRIASLEARFAVAPVPNPAPPPPPVAEPSSLRRSP